MKTGYYSIVFLFFLALFFSSGTTLFAFGKKEAAKEAELQNKTWVLCITAFDTSAMSPSLQTAGDTVTRSLAGALQNLDFRFRPEDESSYYENYAFSKSVTQAGETLAKKRTDRDLLIFKGDPEWKYQADLKTIDNEILLLEEKLALVEHPPVEQKPAFSIAEKNVNGTFPLPPKPGHENIFCIDEKADAFLKGKLSEYYGRTYLEISMYTRYSSGYTYSDSMLYSSEDFNLAMVEIANRLAATVSVLLPSAVLVHAAPPEAMVLLDGVYIGQGEIDMRTHSPGSAEITVYADNHEPVSLPIDLAPGELAELFIDLSPQGSNIFEAGNPSGSRVFLGSLYVGETPLTLELPRASFSYITLETPEGEIGSAIVRDNELLRGSAQFSQEVAGRADFITAIPVSKEEKRVGNSRNNFYRYYGAFWFILPAALLAGGIAGNIIASNEYVAANNLYGNDPATRERIASKASSANLVRTGSYGAIAASLGITFFQIFRYLRVSGTDSTPLARINPNAEE